MNIVLDGFVCPNCFNTFNRSKDETINNAFTFDRRRGETYCNRCGLVVFDSSITSIAILQYLAIRDRTFKQTKLYKELKIEKRFVDTYEIILKYRAMREAKEREKAEERARKREERKAKAKATREKNKKKKAKKKKKKTKKKQK